MLKVVVLPFAVKSSAGGISLEEASYSDCAFIDIELCRYQHVKELCKDVDTIANACVINNVDHQSGECSPTQSSGIDSCVQGKENKVESSKPKRTQVTKIRFIILMLTKAKRDYCMHCRVQR